MLQGDCNRNILWAVSYRKGGLKYRTKVPQNKSVHPRYSLLFLLSIYEVRKPKTQISVRESDQTPRMRRLI